MRSNARIEILERLYRDTLTDYCVNHPGYVGGPDVGLPVLSHIGRADRYSSGFLPIQFLRRLELNMRCYSDTSLLRDPEYCPADNWRVLSPWKVCLEALLSIPSLSGFEFKLKIESCHLFLGHLGHMLEVFRPV